MHSSVVLIGIVLVITTAGCAAPSENDADNHAPMVRMTPSVTEGVAPLNVSLSYVIEDEDGDALSVQEWSYKNGVRADSVTFDVPGDGIDATEEAITTNLTYYGPGAYKVRLTVSDGRAVVEDEVTIRVTGMPVWNWMHVDWMNLTASCPVCTGVSRESPLGLGPTGGDFCEGFRNGVNEGDCAWLQVQPEWVGKIFHVNSTNQAPIMVSLRTDCDYGLMKTKHMYVDPGPYGENSGKIPEDSGCILFWSHDKAPTTVRVVIY